ncbi:hypothetical protein Bca52824_026683 [Brassica carinata]|uniref:Uncharacterized protein n=1 Tax=Brassica carinata TaxID=52824 RepID=A0A8X7SI66_BRACI|nr:hypothetical protein Bca52824_026683 [Brassica carinata]
MVVNLDQMTRRGGPYRFIFFAFPTRLLPPVHIRQTAFEHIFKSKRIGEVAGSLKDYPAILRGCLLPALIHAGLSTATFLDDPAACANPLTILTVQDVVAVENDPRLTISFAITPEEERLLLLDERPDAKISTQIKEMERKIRRDLGLAERIISNSRKRKAGDDNHVQTSSPESSGLKPRPNQSGKRRKTVASASVVKTHPYSLRAGGGDRTAAVERPGVEKKVSAKGRAAATLDRLPRQVHCTPTKNPPDHALTPPTAKFDRSVMCSIVVFLPQCSGFNSRWEDDQQPERPSTALILYRDPLCVQPQSYVLPPKVPSIFRYGAEGGSPVAWEKTNPHRYRPVGSVRSCHPPRGPKFDSKAKVTSTRSEDFCNTVINGIFLQEAPQIEESVRERTIEPLEDPTHKEAIVPGASTGEVAFRNDCSRRQHRRSGVQVLSVVVVMVDSWCAFFNIKMLLASREAVTPTDVDYSQQEENRHERDLDPLGRGGRKHSIPCPERTFRKAVLLLLM